MISFVAGFADNTYLSLPKDRLPYTTLMYTTGPGAGRANLTGVNTSHPEYRQQAVVKMNQETHGGEDVAIYARGPMSHLFHTTHEQHYVAHVMAYASCVGANKKHCHHRESSSSHTLADALGHANSINTLQVYVINLVVVFWYLLNCI